MYLECTVQLQKNVSRKNRKLRKLRRLGVHVGILYRRDILRLARRYGLKELEAAVDA
jgi:G:T-mismatch repair DNA endonuclease (very short patch repair protein)